MTLTTIKKKKSFIQLTGTFVTSVDIGLDPPYLEPAYYKWWRIFMRLVVFVLFFGWGGVFAF